MTTPLPFPLSGLADEAADGIAGQIQAQQALGWGALELRLLDGQQVCSPATSDLAFAQAMEQIESAGLRVSSFASAIGNWSRPITGDFSIDLTDLRTLSPRLHRAGTRWVRTMSWMQAGTTESAWRLEGLRRYREMAKIAADHDIVLLHENCEGWGGSSALNARRFMEELNHPNVGYLFDIGNTVSYGQDPWEFYQTIRPFIHYIHIKDCQATALGTKSQSFTYPGQGDAQVAAILQDLIKSGYRAGATIEPHVANIVHHGAQAAKASPAERFNAYVRYGRELVTLLNGLRKS
jgi:sugar phosphate isomerase/epimerase